MRSMGDFGDHSVVSGIPCFVSRVLLTQKMGVLKKWNQRGIQIDFFPILWYFIS